MQQCAISYNDKVTMEAILEIFLHEKKSFMSTKIYSGSVQIQTLKRIQRLTYVYDFPKSSRISIQCEALYIYMNAASI